MAKVVAGESRYSYRHSVRGAATSATANAGVTMADILKAADWSSESVFTKFYYKLIRSSVWISSAVQQGIKLTTNYHS